MDAVSLLFDRAKILEENKQYKRVLDIYSRLIQRLFVGYEEASPDVKSDTIHFVGTIIKHSEQIRLQIESQERLDMEKKNFLQNERLYTEYFDNDNDQILSNISPPPYPSHPSYFDALPSLYDNTFREHQKNSSTCPPIPLISYVKDKIYPEEFKSLPQYPKPPLSYSISRKFTVHGGEDLIHPSSRLASEKICDSQVNKKAGKDGRSLEEITSQIRYALSTGVRTCIMKLMGCEVWDPIQMHHQLENQMYYFSDVKERIQAHRGMISLVYEAKCEFTFCEYGQFLFRELRRQNGVDCDYFIQSMCAHSEGGESSIVDMVAEGKSQASFFLSSDGEFVIKTLTEAEFDFFQQILISYFEYQSTHPHTMITRIYGLHQLQIEKEEPLYFLIMENIIPLASDITRYDLKGSSIGRAATEEDKEIGGVLKDQDFHTPLILDEQLQTLLFHQLSMDCSWLEQHDIMDYSLLLGVAHRPKFLMNSAKSDHRSPSLFKAVGGGFRSTDENGVPLDTLYYAGIIDILQPYNIKKKVEHAIKSISAPSTEISCINPVDYSRRFQHFIRDHTMAGVALGDTASSSFY